MKKIGILAALFVLLLQPLAAQRQDTLFVLHTSDTHSRIEPISQRSVDRNAGLGGVVRRVSFVKQYRADHPGVLLFDCGDFSQGTPYYNMFRGELEVKMMNLMGYDAMTIGNHEFDFGLENMARLFRMADFPVVCANYEVAGTPLEGLVKPYVVLERQGVRVGVFGLSPRVEGLVQAANCEGIVYRDPIPVAREMARLLRKEERCDVVICLSHLGLYGSGLGDAGDEVLAAQTEGIDLILGGHSHTFLERPAFYENASGQEVPVMHTGRNGVYVGELTLEIKKNQ